MSTFKKYMSIIQEGETLPKYEQFMKMDVSKMNDDAFLNNLKEAIDKLSETHDNQKQKLDNFYNFISKNLHSISKSKENDEIQKNFEIDIDAKEKERKNGKSYSEKTINEFIFQFIQKVKEYLKSKTK